MLLQVLHVRISRMFEKDFKRLEVAIKPGSAADNVWQTILFPRLRDAYHKGRVLAGMAPQSDLERIVQQAINDWS